MRAMLDAHKDVRCGEETRVVPRLLQVHSHLGTCVFLNFFILSTLSADEESLDEKPEGKLEVRGGWPHWGCA